MPENFQGRYNRVFAYLTKCRCIDAAVILQCFDDKKLYQDTRNNAVFVGYNNEGEAKFACVRGTLSDVQYRGDCMGSDKSCPFVLEGSYKKKIFVFESPIDTMSHATLTNIAAKNHTAWAKHTRLSLSCSADTALLGYLKHHDEIEEIIFCLDNDEAGKKSTIAYLKKYSEKGYNVSESRPAVGKDYNEFLQIYTNAIKEKNNEEIQVVNTKSVTKGR